MPKTETVSTETTEESVKRARIKRRIGKASLTRLGKTVSLQVAGNRSTEEVRKSLDIYIYKHLKILPSNMRS